MVISFFPFCRFSSDGYLGSCWRDTFSLALIRSCSNLHTPASRAVLLLYIAPIVPRWDYHSFNPSYIFIASRIVTHLLTLLAIWIIWDGPDGCMASSKSSRYTYGIGMVTLPRSEKDHRWYLLILCGERWLWQWWYVTGSARLLILPSGCT
jgi:hypothetical protein